MNDSIAVATAAGSPAAASVGQSPTFDLAGELHAMPILAVQETRGWERVANIDSSSARPARAARAA